MSSRRKVTRDVVARMADGKLFRARGAATENARSPKVDRRSCYRTLIGNPMLVVNVAYTSLRPNKNEVNVASMVLSNKNQAKHFLKPRVLRNANSKSRCLPVAVVVDIP